MMYLYDILIVLSANLGFKSVFIPTLSWNMVQLVSFSVR